MPDQNDTDRAARLRDNKRRHRARQKEYTASLEHRLTLLQQQGVQATIEVQLAAKKVAEENNCLRNLLHHLGVEEQTINVWISKAKCTSDMGVHSQQDNARSSVVRVCPPRTDTELERFNRSVGQEKDAIRAPPLEAQQMRAHQEDQTNDNVRPNRGVIEAPTRSSVENTAPAGEGSPPSTGNTCSPDHGCHHGTLSIPTLASTPCKLLSHLAANPATDLTQLHPDSDGEADQETSEDGVSCSQAYRLLMQYATTEAKQDAVARVLEEGCVPNAGSTGGCEVKSKTISQALLDICL